MTIPAPSPADAAIAVAVVLLNYCKAVVVLKLWLEAILHTAPQ